MTTHTFGLKLDTVQYDLVTSSGTGYDWYIQSVDGIAQDKIQSFNGANLNITSTLNSSNTSKPGSPTHRNFSFEPLHKGNYNIVLEYRRIWESEYIKTETIVINVE